MSEKPTLTTEQKSALNYDKHIALTANAGSGKTFVFAKRFVKIALEKNPELDKIIAITFTEKAAGELYGRIVKEVEELMTERTTDFATLNLIRKRLVSANISTIHSFCLNLLRDYSPQAGLDAKMIPIEDYEKDKLFDKAFDDAFEEEILPEQIKSLLRYFGSKKLLRSSIKTAVENRRYLDDYYEKVYSKEENEILNFLKNKAVKFFDKIAFPQFIKVVKLIGEILIELSNAKKPPKDYSLYSELYDKALTEKDAIKKAQAIKEALQSLVNKDGKLKAAVKNNLLDQQKYAREIEVISKFILSFYFNTLDENLEALAYLAGDFFYFYKKVLDKFTEAKYQNGYLDFEDILINANKLLANNDVLSDLQSKYEYIMVDEFQDTNEIQYEIIMPILDKLNRGNLFVVGDEKQSIYMFNNAELEIFDRTKEQVNTNEGVILELPHSFRLKPNNALFVNSVFSKVFANPDKRFNEVEFNPLIVSETVGEGGRVEILLAREIEGEEEIDEAKIIANKIKRLLTNEEIKLSETAILTRQNKFVSEMEKALADEKIPYVVLGGVGYFQELVIRDVQNYLMFLSSVNNDVALVTILRSPFFSLSDADIFKLSFEKGESYWEKLNSFASKNKLAEKIVATLNKHLNYAKSYEIPLLLNKILSETNYWAILTAKENAEQEIANVRKLLYAALGTLKGEAVSLYEFAEKLSDLIKRVKDEGSAPTADSNNAVKIMTFHKSKGLEFDTVFLYKTAEANKNRTVKSREIKFDKEFGMIAKTPSPKGYFNDYETNPLVWIYDYYHNRKELAEQKRLFYVGVTRAKQNLFISAKIKKSNNINKNSMFGFLVSALGFSVDDPSITIQGNLSFETRENTEFRSYKINIEQNKIEDVEFEFAKNNTERDFEINIKQIDDAEENEFISATKIALYKYCPRKYELTYELGYGKLYGMLKNIDVDDFEIEDKQDEEKESLPANVLGSVLHKALELQITKENFDEILSKAINTEAAGKDYAEKLKSKAEKILKQFLNTEIFTWLKNQENFKNEFEVYAKAKDYFLYGIIDKLIFDGDTIIVADYKSDKISDGNYERKFNQYEYQLKFYLYILSLLYPDVKNFEARLIFLSSPENSISKKYFLEEVKNFGNEIDEIVNNIRSRKFPKNESNCKHCVYFENNKCVADDE